MPAKNIECQLAQGQIGRYLAGTNMSPEAIEQLERHIAECPDCGEFVDAKRSSLRELAASRHAVVEMPDFVPPATPEPAPKLSNSPTPTQALIQAIREKSNPLANEAVLETVREPAPERKRHWKALGYSAALGAVLLAMSHFSANPAALFGERVGAPDSTTATTPEKTVKTLAPVPKSDGDPFTAEAPILPKSDTATPPSTNVPTNPTPTTKAAKPTTPNSIASTPNQPKTTIKARRAGRPIRTTKRAKPAVRSGNSIRVYDANGKPIN